MAQRVFTVTLPAWSRDQMAALLNTALGLTGVQAFGNATSVTVDHASLTPAHDAAIQAVLTAYVFDPLYGVPAEVLRLRNSVVALRQWKADADTSAASLGTAITNWVSSGTYTAAKDNVLKATLQGLETMTTRLGKLCDGLADITTVHGDN